MHDATCNQARVTIIFLPPPPTKKKSNDSINKARMVMLGPMN
jgi:hypothetical protein